MSKVNGIDLGTTNSCVAVMDGKNPKINPSQNNLCWIVFFCIKNGAIANKGTQVKYVLNINAMPIHKPQNK